MRILTPALIGLFMAAASAAALHPATAGGIARVQNVNQANAATDFSAAKRRKHKIAREYGSRYPHGPGTIACTRAGCSPVPAGCHAVEERTVDDSPSGFQIIVC